MKKAGATNAGKRLGIGMKPKKQQNLRKVHTKQRPKRGSMRKEAEEIEMLEKRIEAGAPRSGSNPLAIALPASDPATGFEPYVGAKHFEQLPLSWRTKKALSECRYTEMTDIQCAAIPHALCGRDVLGAAKTGSGKTLAFLIPVIEQLYRLRWGSTDGVGALIITPTRELAMQIFEELKRVGKYHSFSGGAIIGGRKKQYLELEKDRVSNLNIVVCTPGRLVQHMNETVNFDCSALQVLVLDEADRLLDMGFSADLNHILSQIPKERKTFLFSATQTRSVQDLARLSLQDPEYLAVHAESTVATPNRLHQTAVVVPLDKKLDTLWSFVKTHLRNKILVFFSCCKQVKFVHEAFKKLRPGIPVSCLHGKQKQAKRLDIFFKFVESKAALLLATDVAARGLDFPSVDWVVQADCPDSVETYIHRAGRTARYRNSGRCLLLLDPSERKMLELLQSKVPIREAKPDSRKIQSVSQQIAALLSQDAELKTLAQRAFVKYLSAIKTQSNKEVFDLQKLPLDEFAASLGLPSTPHVRFLERRPLQSQAETKLQGQDFQDHGADANTDLLQKKRPRDIHDPNPSEAEGSRLISKKKKLKINPGKGMGQRLVFDEDGNALPPLLALAKESEDPNPILEQGVVANNDVATVVNERYKKLQKLMKQRDEEDRVREKERLRNKKLKKKAKLRKAADEGKERDTDEEEEEEDEEEEESSQQSQGGSDGERQPSLLSGSSLAEQEALAAKLLGAWR